MLIISFVLLKFGFDREYLYISAQYSSTCRILLYIQLLQKKSPMFRLGEFLGIAGSNLNKQLPYNAWYYAAYRACSYDSYI